MIEYVNQKQDDVAVNLSKSVHVLIVEDEADISELLAFNFKLDGFTVDCLNSGEHVCSFVKQHQPNIILLDVMIPEKDGFQVCRELKADDRTAHIPVIFLTAKSLEHNVISGLEIGADDYISKPFSIPILMSKMKAVLRRTNAETHDVCPVVVGNLILNPTKMTVQLDGSFIRLNATEFSILHALIKSPGWVLTRNQLMNACHADDQLSTPRSVDVLMVTIRKKLGPYAVCIETVRGVGYKFKTIDG